MELSNNANFFCKKKLIMTYDYDLFVIGGGSGGVRSARLAVAEGKKVALAEKSRLGGTCVIRGCVPKKLMSYAANLAYDFLDSRGLGWNSSNSPSFNWQKLRDNIQLELNRLENIYSSILENVTVYNNHAKIITPHTIQLKHKIVTAHHIVIATGGKPNVPNIEGNEYAITSNECFTLDKLPKSLVIYGGSFIAVEFACIFKAYGVDVTLIYRGTKLLRGFEEDLKDKLMDSLKIQGINIILNTTIKKIVKKENCKIYLNNSAIINSECILFATGRTPNTKNLWLDNLAIRINKKGSIVTDEYFRTSISNIYALGDVSNHINLTPVAINEAIQLNKILFKQQKNAKMDYNNIPFAVFTYPPIASVGLDEEKASMNGYQIETFKSEFKPLKSNLSFNPHKTFIKLIIDKISKKILGLHMLGFDAPEIIQGFAVAIKMGATKDDFDATIGVHPTTAEELVTLK